MRPAWTAVGASVTGAGHAELGCQDAHRIESLPDALVIAVADGAGSAPLSANGAALATRRAVGSALEHLILGNEPGQVVAGALMAARHALDDAAALRGCRIGDLATTLLVVAVTDGVIATAQVGDGAVVVLDDDGLRLIDGVERGEYLNETSFLTAGAWQREARVSINPDSGLHGLAVMSDGIQNLALDLAHDEPHEGFFRPLWDWMGAIDDPLLAQAELRRFLSSERVQSRTDDDITLVVATPALVAEPAPA